MSAMGWRKSRLKYIAEVDPPLRQTLKMDDDTSVSFLPMEAVGEDGGLDLSRERPLSAVREGYTPFQNGDVIVAKITPCFENGKGALAAGLTNGVGFGTTELFVLRPSAGVDARFLNYLVSSDAFRQPATAQMYGAGGQKRVPPSFVQDFKFGVPDLTTQRAIADFLDRETAKIDALLAAKRSAERLGEEQRQAIVDAAVTGGFGTSERCRPPARLCWLHSVPTSWSVRPLKTIADVQTGVALGRTFEGVRTIVVPYIRVANVQDGYLDLSDVSDMEIPETELERHRLRRGDLLMNEGGDYDKLGRGAVWNAPVDPCIHQNHVFAVRPHNPEDAAWLELFNRSTVARHFFILRSKQSTNLASVSSSNLKQLPVLWPPPEERRRLVGFVHDQLAGIDARARLSKRSIELLGEQRSVLITAAVTGQIDMRRAS